MADDVLTELVKQVADDEEVRHETQLLAIDALREARKIMRIGVPQEKLSLIRAFLPILARNAAGKKDEEDESIAEMRTQMASLLREVREGGMG